MAAAETALPSISTLATLGPFPDTQEDFLKVGTGGVSLGGLPGVLGCGHRVWGSGLHLALESRDPAGAGVLSPGQGAEFGLRDYFCHKTEAQSEHDGALGSVRLPQISGETANVSRGHLGINPGN